LSIRLSTDGEVLALNLYARRRDAFDADDVDLALILTAHATSAINTARVVTDLRTAMRSRHIIGVAQGLLMSRFGLSMEQSFEVLRRYSNDRNMKLRDVAAFVVEHRNLPGLSTQALTDAGDAATGSEPETGLDPVG
jgi:diaminopimelate decarboxylase